ncbi:MAG: hypothetical protein R3242_03615 [Akkermansiaceae bacterium]|nr:hypothetical protein [Akkermansiaceae bacterium]
MRETLIILGLGIMAAAMRSSRSRIMRKLGAVTLLVASFFLFYFLTGGNVLAGTVGVLVWAFLPWFELLTRIRRMRMPVDNRLKHKPLPNPAFFPNASEAAAAMDAEGFEHVSDCCWQWDGMSQYFRLYWNPEVRASAAICLCEQSDVAFAFISITSKDDDGKIWRTTNYPFAPTLCRPPAIEWNHLPCSQNCFHQILTEHLKYLERNQVKRKELDIPDPETIEQDIETEMRQQIEHNLDTGIIHMTEDGHFKYSKRGLFFLWLQFLKDMVRFC